MQFGGDDQWSNMLAGTDLIRRKNSKDAYAMTITLLLNSEGKKMGKTAKGAVWLDPNKTSPFEFYQYWRNVEDQDVMKCIRMLTFISLDEIDANFHVPKTVTDADITWRDVRQAPFAVYGLYDYKNTEPNASLITFLEENTLYRDLNTENENVFLLIVFYSFLF